MESNRPNEVHSETDAARAGSTPHIVRWILLISLVAVIVLLSIIWMTGAATQTDAEQNVEVSSEIQEVQEDATSDDTDSIVGENADEFETAEPGAEEGPGVPTVAN
jgi:hypothetical protein